MTLAAPADLDDLLTRARIADVLASFCAFIDAGDYVGVAELFDENCVTDYGPGAGGAIRGRAAFLDRIRRSQGRFSRTHHHIGEILFSDEASGPSTITYVTASHRRLDGSRYTSRLQYRDRWTRAGSEWRIAERRSFMAMTDDSLTAAERSEGDLNWIPRHPN